MPNSELFFTADERALMMPHEIEEIDERHLSCSKALVTQCRTKTYNFQKLLVDKEKTIKTCFDLCTRPIEKFDNTLHYESKIRENINKANAYKAFNSESELGLLKRKRI
ncbi:hypothetical protein TrLO_g9276 [Triparma laevis f. longispina]|nr:hypothetical protein TrLO_g9276 [Triparma laevis f. longispina]